MASAEIITIGTELLLGEINDTNSRYIARALRDIGIDIYRITSVGDNASRITATIREALVRSEIVITTGGLGPTVDDPTRQAVADTFQVPLEFHDVLWAEIEEHFTRYGRKPTENNKRQAYIPVGAQVIHNPVGTAPAFIFEREDKTSISLPGVPKEMEYLMQNFVLDYLKARYQQQDSVIKAVVVHTIGKGESVIDELIGDLETLSNPTVGLLAKPGQTDIRITAKASSGEAAQAMIRPVLEIVRTKLAGFVYGEDEVSLCQIVANLLREKHKKLAVLEYGSQGEIFNHLNQCASGLVIGKLLENEPSNAEMKSSINGILAATDADLVLGVLIRSVSGRLQVLLGLADKDHCSETERPYDGPDDDAKIWAMNTGMDLLRRYLSEQSI